MQKCIDYNTNWHIKLGLTTQRRTQQMIGSPFKRQLAKKNWATAVYLLQQLVVKTCSDNFKMIHFLGRLEEFLNFGNSPFNRRLSEHSSRRQIN